MFLKKNFLFFILLLFISPLQAEEKKNLLVLHSYHSGYEWTDGIHKAIIETLKNEKNLEIYVEYLDLIRKAESAEYLATLVSFLKDKYKDKKIDVIISVDDNALHLLLKNREVLFNNIPIVFCGVNNFYPEMIKDHKNITGINEKKSIKETVELALKLSKNAKRLGVISGTRLAEISNLNEFKKEVKNIKGKIKIEYLTDIELEEITDRLKEFSDNDIIIYLSYLRSPSGKVYQNKDVLKKISENTKALIFTVSDHMVIEGVVGGKVTYASSQGEEAAKMAISILKGKRANDIPILMESPNKFVFNGDALIRHDIPLIALPKGSTIINKTDKYLKKAWDKEVSESFFGYDLFMNHGTIMLIIDPRTGTILDANLTAFSFYGYPNLVGKKIQEINTLSAEKVKQEMERAKSLRKNYFNFRHRLANGEIRDVEVYSYPINLGKENLLFSLVFDITDKLIAQKEKEKERKRVIEALVGLLVMTIAFFIVLFMYTLSRRRSEKALIEKNHQLLEAQSRIKTLEGIIPICMYCKKIRDDQGYWNQLEKYITENTSALLSHGTCPDCAKKYYGEYLKDK